MIALGWVYFALMFLLLNAVPINLQAQATPFAVWKQAAVLHTTRHLSKI